MSAPACAPAPACASAAWPPTIGADFKAYGDDLAGRQKAWARTVAESRRLADEFATLLRQPSIDARPLA